MPDEVIEKLKKFRQEVDKVAAKREISLGDLLSDDFISNNSNFSSLDELFAASPFSIENEDDFNKIPIDELNLFISSSTNFSTWKAMLSSAVVTLYNRELGLQ